MISRLASGVCRLQSFCADILAPRTCVGCGEEGAWCCARCAGSVVAEPNTVCVGCGTLSRCAETCVRCRDAIRLRAVCAAVQYDDSVVQKLIQTVKYAPAADVAGAFALFVHRFAVSEAGRALRTDAGTDTLVVPVPLHWWRERGRGFNQSAIIARQLATAGFGTLMVDVLHRKKTMPWRVQPQAHLPRAARLQNVADAFVCARPHAVTGRNIVIVDDVVTTGATLSACARALRPHGVRGVWGFTLAREP